MQNFSKKIFGLAGAAVVFAGMAFGQNATCSGGTAQQTPLIRVEGTTELAGEYSFTCTTTATVPVTINILDILSLPVTSKALTTSSPAYTEALAVVTTGGYPGTFVSATQGTVSGSQVSFSGVSLPTAATAYTITIVNIRVNATSLTIGSGTPPAITESSFISGTNVNSVVTGSTAVAYAFTGLGTQTAYKSAGTAGTKGSYNFLVCQGYNKNSSNSAVTAFINTGENFATSFKGAGTAGSNGTLGSEFTNNTETGYVPAAWPNTAGASNIANTATMLQVVYNNIPANVSLYVATSIVADQGATNGTLLLVTSPSNTTAVSASTSTSAVANTAQLSVSNGSATAYYLFVPVAGGTSNTTTETWSIPAYIVTSSNTVASSSTAMNAVVSFAPVGSTQFPNFVIGSSSTTTTLSTFNQCTTSLLFPFVTNQLGFDTGLAIANTSTDPFGKSGATAQAGTCSINFYGAGAPSPSNVTTPSVPSGTVYTTVLSGIGAGFQGYLIAQCNFQYAHGFAFITDGVGANGGLSQGYLAGVIPDTNQVSRATANPIGSVTATGQGETLGN